METMDAIRKRASIRKYKPDKLSEAQIETLMEAAMLSPSGMNLRPYRFIVIRDERLLSSVKALNPYAGHNAPNAIVVIGDAARSPLMWQNDCGAATENILLCATDMGLGTCWCAMYPFIDRAFEAKEILHLAKHEEAYSLILIGVPDEEKHARGSYDPSRVTIF